MRVTFVGTGDAFCTGGRAHTCIRVDSGARTLVVDFGAAALAAWRGMGFSSDDIDTVVISHLHGDHFGALPFILLEAQFSAFRKRPLVIAGPPGCEARVRAAMEVFYPGSAAIAWSFDLVLVEITPGVPTKLAGLDVVTCFVEHPSGAPSTGVRISDGAHTFAYSGDTMWTPALIPLADKADLFVCECSSAEPTTAAHIDWQTLSQNLHLLKARRIELTHGNESVFALEDAIAATGTGLAFDGKIIDL